MSRSSPPKEVWGVWDGYAMTVFRLKTYAKQEASEARRCGDKHVVAVRYEQRKSKKSR
jgi:hypothetical protein